MAKSKIKKPYILWKGCFNWQYQMTVLYRPAPTLGRARELMFTAIADKHDVSISTVRNYFLSKPHSFEITIEKAPPAIQERPA